MSKRQQDLMRTAVSPPPDFIDQELTEELQTRL